MILLGSDDICFACPTEFALDLAAGARVSFFPMRAVAGRGVEGLRWSVAGLDIAPDAASGPPTRRSAGAMRVAFDGPGMLVILPVELLGAVIPRLAPGLGV